MFKWLKNYKDYIVRVNKRHSDKPYIEIISEGIDPMGRVRMEFDWNPAFIRELRDNGFRGDTEEDIVHNWFTTITISRAADFLEEDDELALRTKINPAEHPDLQ